jgi:hypothetical protein
MNHSVCALRVVTAPTGKRADVVSETFVSLNNLLWVQTVEFSKTRLQVAANR